MYTYDSKNEDEVSNPQRVVARAQTLFVGANPIAVALRLAIEVCQRPGRVLSPADGDAGNVGYLVVAAAAVVAGEVIGQPALRRRGDFGDDPCHDLSSSSCVLGSANISANVYTVCCYQREKYFSTESEAVKISGPVQSVSSLSETRS